MATESSSHLQCVTTIALSLYLAACAQGRPPSTVLDISEQWSGSGRMELDGGTRVVALAGRELRKGPGFAEVVVPHQRIDGASSPLYPAEYQLLGAADVTADDGSTEHWLLAEVPGEPRSSLKLFRSRGDLQSFEPIAAYPGAGVSLTDGRTYAIKRLCSIAGIEDATGRHAPFVSAIACRQDGASARNCVPVIFELALAGSEWSVHASQQAPVRNQFSVDEERTPCVRIATAPGRGFERHTIAVLDGARLRLYVAGQLNRGPELTFTGFELGAVPRDLALLRSEELYYYVAILRSDIRSSPRAGSLEVRAILVLDPPHEVLVEDPTFSQSVPDMSRFIGTSNSRRSSGLHEIFVFDDAGIRMHPTDLRDE